MSDTHSLTSHIKNPIPDGDVFVHAGDFTRTGKLSEVREFNAWIAQVARYTGQLDTDDRHRRHVCMRCCDGSYSRNVYHSICHLETDQILDVPQRADHFIEGL